MKTYSASLLIVLALSLPAANLMAQDADQPRQPRGPRLQQGDNGGPGDGQRPSRGQRPGNRQQNPGDLPPGGQPPEGQRPVPPLINALDANHDGVIDETEIANASKALRTLDKNGDGKLTMEELRPQNMRGGPGGPGGPGNPGGQDRPSHGPGRGGPPPPDGEN